MKLAIRTTTMDTTKLVAKISCCLAVSASTGSVPASEGKTVPFCGNRGASARKSVSVASPAMPAAMHPTKGSREGMVPQTEVGGWEVYKIYFIFY